MLVVEYWSRQQKGLEELNGKSGEDAPANDGPADGSHLVPLCADSHPKTTPQSLTGQTQNKIPEKKRSHLH